MDKLSFSRRKFFYKCITMSPLVAGYLAISSCKNKNNATGNKQKTTFSKTDCDDLSQVGSSQLQIRKDLGYVKDSYVAGSSCGNCKHYLLPKTPGHCGGCELFDGPVQVTGYCVQYEPIAPSAP